ncbi:hypothetical protein LCGC14_3083890 [marine sediment metagenome]|uniref:Uncharacterized protein n=1 Tax=marine sediment metagenome TaxID=412755 RepID=A0A0F8WCH0_9ZZZZ
MAETEPKKFEKNLYLVIVDTNIYHYVYCSYDAIMNERACLHETGNDHRVQFVRLVLTDLDAINHVHFC